MSKMLTPWLYHMHLHMILTSQKTTDIIATVHKFPASSLCTYVNYSTQLSLFYRIIKPLYPGNEKLKHL